MTDVIFGGIEGGASFSFVTLFNGKGERLCEYKGPGTNFWIIGYEEAKKRIVALMKHAREMANIPDESKLTCMCLSLSGAEEEKANEELRINLLNSHPHLSDDYVICSDTEGPIAAAHDCGGVVLIAGTGSNALLINPDGSKTRCGGWGHILGDEGGAYWVAHKALKIHFDSEDNLEQPPHGYSTEIVWETAKEFFKISNRLEILPHIYNNFQKSVFSQLCQRLSVKAYDGDPLCRWLFEDAGRALAKNIIAVASGANETLLNSKGGLPVVCVGSVWKSWPLLKPGFASEIESRSRIRELSLLELTTSAAIGAVYIAAKASNYDLPRDYSKNYNVFYHYIRDDEGSSL